MIEFKFQVKKKEEIEENSNKFFDLDF